MNLTKPKQWMRILLSASLIFFAKISISQEFEVLFFEDFENNGSLPSGWENIIISGSRIWRFENGGYAPPSAPTFRHPPAAYSGSYNALYQIETRGQVGRLITPPIDLKRSYPEDDPSTIKPTLVFWHAQDIWGVDVDELKVHYRLNNTSPWIELGHYTITLADWTKQEIILPDTARWSTAFQLAFDGISNWGYGVCIDDVTIEERGVLPRVVETFNLRQTNMNMPSGSSINPFSYISAFVSGNTGNVPINSITLSFTGTEINDIDQIRLFHTRDSLFSVVDPIPADVIINDNNITITAPTFNLLTGSNFIWFSFDINSSSAYGNIIDFTLDQNSVLLGSQSFPPSALDPVAVATIHESLLYDDFEDTDYWTLTSLWEIGTPIGTGAYDATYPFSGSKVLATNLNGNYPPNISTLNPHTAYSVSVNAKYYQNLSVTYKRWLAIEFFDKARVKVSTNGGANWSTIYSSGSDVTDRSWRNISHNISSLATRKEDVMVMFSIDESNYAVEYGGWNVDNFAITGEFIHSDVGVKEKIIPVQQCGLTSNEIVSVVVKNYGGATVNVPFEVGYSLNGGATYTKEWFSDPIASEADDEGDNEIVFTFSTPANLSIPGLKSLVFRTFLDGDQDAANDAYSTTLFVFPTVSYPYQASFESTSSFWYPSGTNSSWQWGTPSGTYNNKASHGTKVWATSLAQNYKNNELSYLESPCFDLTGAEYPIFSFDYIMQIEQGVDGLAVQYSVDGGSWSLLTAHNDYSANWYDTEDVEALGTDGWSQNKTNYVTAKTLLPNDAWDASNVKFRFVFASNSSVTHEGVALDMVKVYELPYDLGITEPISPESDCEIGADVTLELKMENFGIRPVPMGTDIPVRVQVNSGNIITETITLPYELNQLNSTLDFETVNTFNLFNEGSHDILAYTALQNDDDRTNDTLKTQVSVLGMPSYSIGPDIGTMQPDTITLDAGEGYESYAWFKWDEVDTWDPVGTEQTYQVELNGWGTYKIEITNAIPCFAKDSITIAQSDKDVGVLSIDNLYNECFHPDPIYPSVTLKFYGNVPFDGVESFPVVAKVDGVVVLNEEYTPAENWGDSELNDEAVFTFDGSIDLSQAKEYAISIFTNFSLDLDRSNDASNEQISTWGLPEVVTSVRRSVSEYISLDTVITMSADTLVLRASDGFETYQWERQLPGQTTWSPLGSGQNLNLSSVANNLISSSYRVTVEAFHGCGTDSDTIYVNANDLSIEAIESPDEIICYSDELTPLSIVIKNKGRDTYPIGTEINAFVVTPTNEQSVTITLTNPFEPNQELIYQFPEMELLPIGDNYISYSISIANDPIPENNSMDRLVTVDPSPSVTITPSVLYMIFGAQDYYDIEPEYSEDVTSYLWQDNTDDPTYLIYGPPAYSDYTVTVENIYGCPDDATLKVVTNDLVISQIVSPSNDCVLNDETPVTFTLFNNGNATYPIGTEIDVELILNGSLITTETVILTSNFTSKTSRSITLTQKIDLYELETATVQLNISSEYEEVYYTNNTLNKTVSALGYPSITLGPDREVHAWEEILDPGYYEYYLWQDESTNRTYTATEDGTYSVTVTDFSGCQGYAEVTLTFFIDDIGVTEMAQPLSACDLSSSETVEFVFKNFGTHTFPSGTPIDIGFSHDGQNHSETIYLVDNFAPDEELSVTFSETVNLSERKIHDITIWVDVDNDMVTENNSVTFQVNAFPDVYFSFGLPDGFYSNQPYILDAGEGYTSYLWQDESTDQTFLVTETGLYSVTVTNDYGCIGYDEIFITILIPDYGITGILSPVSACDHINNELVTVNITNLGTDTLRVDDELPLALWLDEQLVANETLVLTQEVEPGEAIQYTFIQTINMSATGVYLVGIETNHPLDQNTDNDLLEVSVETYVNPTVDLGGDQVSNTGPIILDAGPGFASYLWQDGSTVQTYTVTVTGDYSVTVTDNNGCEGFDEVHVSILIPDYAVTDIISPITSCQLSQSELVVVEISNLGTDTLYLGNEIPLTLFVNDNEIAEEVFTLPQRLNPEEVIEFTFEATIDLSESGEYTITAQTNHPLDQYNTNDLYSSDIEIYANPIVDLGPDQTINEPVVLDAGAGYVSYLWQDGSTGQTFTVTQTGLYHVTVTDDNSCQGYDEVFIIYDDTPYIIISSVVSPIEECNQPDLPVEVILTNQGGGPVTSSTPFQIVYRIGTIAQVTETITVSQPFVVGEFMNYTFNQGLNIAAGNYTMNFWTIFNEQPSEQTNHDMVILPSPIFSLGPDTLEVEFPYVLIAGIDNVDYLWSNGSTESSITVYQTGKYWLEVTNSYGCSSSDTIYLHDGNWVDVIPGTETLVKVYPNPVRNTLSIEVIPQKPGEFTFELFSSQGQRLFHSKNHQINTFIKEINMDSYIPGIYLLKVSFNGRWLTTKIVVDR
jgi:hypothetical protein